MLLLLFRRKASIAIVTVTFLLESEWGCFTCCLKFVSKNNNFFRPFWDVNLRFSQFFLGGFRNFSVDVFVGSVFFGEFLVDSNLSLSVY